MITLRELTMLRFQNAVTDKPVWTEKVGGTALLPWQDPTGHLKYLSPGL